MTKQKSKNRRSKFFNLVAALGLVVAASQSMAADQQTQQPQQQEQQQRRHRHHRRFKAVHECAKENGITLQRGQRPTEQQRSVIDSCLEKKGITPPPPPPEEDQGDQSGSNGAAQ